MTDANQRTLRANASLDGELDAMEQLAFERALADDLELAAEHLRLTAVRDAFRRAAPREAAPQALADRIAGLTAPVPEETAASVAKVIPFPPQRRTWSPRGALALAASFGVLGLAVGAGIATLRAPAVGPEATQIALVNDFTRAALSAQPFDVASSDRHTVKPWLSGRTTISAEIVDLAPQGFALAGGRITVLDRMPAPTLVYRHNEHFIALTELPLDAPGTGGNGGVETIDGYHVARWSGPSLAYLAVSDADAATLAEFVAAFRAAHAPASEPRGG